MHRTVAANIIRALLFGAAVFFAVGPSFSGSPAEAIAGNAGPVTVTVTAKSASTVGVRVTAPSGVEIYEIRAHLCVPGDVSNTYDFGFQGQLCSNAPIGTGDAEKVAAYADGASQGSLEMHVEAGSVQWVNERGFPGTLTCGPDKTCNIVVQVQITDATVYYTAALCIGASCPQDPAGPDGGNAVGVAGPPPASPPAVPSANPDVSANANVTPPPTSAAPVGQNPCKPSTTKPPATSGVAASPIGSSTPTTTTTPCTPAAASGTSRGGGTSSSSSGQGVDAHTTSQQATGVISADGDTPSRGVRVFVAALAGALGGARIVSVVSRTRRRTATASI
jgi:hypothetical protein